MQKENGIVASLEGISGCGKTYFARKLRDEFQDLKVDFVSELSERVSNALDDRIIAALSYTGDGFFRMGFPKTETFLLLALKIFDYEAAIQPTLDVDGIVIEDRGIDTIAVYQSIILSGRDSETRIETANKIYELGAKWRRPPDLTFLIDDDFDTAIKRAEQRSGASYGESEMHLLRDAATLYLDYAKYHKHRIVLLDRRSMSDREILETIRARILAKRQCT